ncbi:MAG: cell division ATP-binding protein FtsE [Abyssibacter sp.]|uniref:cell division ATP-binding protein FtsE n=1 Tax=Abyssibacter sp. TaxID=2320200 RepID=UPI00321AEFA5
MGDIVYLHRVSKRYPGGHDALNDVTLTLEQGEMAFLTGHSGAGKSTLLKLIALIERPSRGQVVVNSQNIAQVRRHQVARYRRNVGVIFQNFNLLNDRTVFDNVALPLVIRGETRHTIARRVRAALDTVGLLEKERQYPLVLSGGEQQRVGIARAIVAKPPLILADEPTGNLDPALSAEIMELFQRFNEVGVSLLIATHDVELIRSLPYREIALQGGRVLDRAAAAPHESSPS